jgi:hypothetical protein
VQSVFCADTFLWGFVVAWGKSEKTGDEQFVESQQRAMKTFDGRAVMMLGQENQTKHLNVSLVQHRLEEGSEVVYMAITNAKDTKRQTSGTKCGRSAIFDMN